MVSCTMGNVWLKFGPREVTLFFIIRIRRSLGLVFGWEIKGICSESFR